MKQHDIPPKLVVFMDQTGKQLMGTKDKTYEKRGVEQVDIAAKDEKRAYTLCVATTANGDVLPFQQVWSGTTKALLPHDIAEGMNEARELGFHFASAASKKKTSHFSTFKTMKEVRQRVISNSQSTDSPCCSGFRTFSSHTSKSLSKPIPIFATLMTKKPFSSLTAIQFTSEQIFVHSLLRNTPTSF